MNHDLHFWEIDWHHNHYFIAFYGLLAYNIIEWSVKKDRYDNVNKKLNFKKYALDHYDNWIVTLMLMPVIVWFGPDLLNLINQMLRKEFQWTDAMYLGVGGLAQAINIALRRIHEMLNNRK